jgi:hypothetical protein
MIELAATSIITVSSALLFGYWYRYTCLLILSAKTSRDYAGDVAAQNQLSFLEVQHQLREGSVDLDRLHQSLDRDYAVLATLFQGSGGEQGLEDRMLQLDYRVMKAWYRVSKNFSTRVAKGALEEMAMVVAHFANSMGERATSSSAA